MIRRFRILWFTCLLAIPSGLPATAATVSVAAASNLVYALDELSATFRREHPDITLTVATGSSGNLVAQISNGAPFDVFLSADLDYPRALIRAGGAAPESLVTFATGRLVLWTVRPEIALTTVEAAIVRSDVRRIAVAQTETAPYGRAARQALERLGLWTAVVPRLAIGENVTQTAQFVETGNAELGFVALSLVLSPQLRTRGQWLEVPADLYAPLDQGAVITRRGAENPAAARFLAFLRGAEARKILERFGYGVPASP